MKKNPPITTEQWFEIIRQPLNEVADRTIQERLWFNSKPTGPASSASDVIETFLSVYKFETSSQEPYLDITDEQRAACLSFAKKLKAYADTKDKFNDRDVIDDPEWEKVRVAAQELIKKLYP